MEWVNKQGITESGSAHAAANGEPKLTLTKLIYEAAFSGEIIASSSPDCLIECTES